MNLRKAFITVLLSCFYMASAAQFILKGTIKTKENESLPGAVISLSNTMLAAVSSASGNFEFKKLKAGDYIVEVRYIGFETHEEKVTLHADKELTIALVKKSYMADEVIISSTRINDKAGFAYSNISKEDIARSNTGKDIPFLLEMLPSVVTTSDAGAGIGYTGIRIRGSDATRINITINGIPVNDAESQGMYWVDLPDLASSVEDIQVQRGVGTSTNGAGAFGGSINIQTDKLHELPYAESDVSYGSFNTLKTTVKAGTGLLPGRFSFDARLSKIISDGYIDRASSNLKSFFITAGYYGKKTLLKLNVFSGKEITYQSWYGTPESRIKNDDVEMQNYIYRNGLDEEDAANLLNSGRTYNTYTYNNQVDDYRQDYCQLHFSHQLNQNWNINTALHYTKGSGYYEEYKKNEPFESLNWDTLYTGNDTITNTDLVRRKWLDNDFYGFTGALKYDSHKKLQSTLGGAWNQYDGDHFGEYIWFRYAVNSMKDNRFYSDNGFKTDGNIYFKTLYDITSRFTVFADMQYRHVGYNFTGFNEAYSLVPQTVNYNFINPKAGITYIRGNGKAYISLSFGNKEPSRDDFTASSSVSRPKSENLTDAEAGYRFSSKKISAAVNFYYMLYKNQLVLTGQLNDVGNYTRTNVNNSYRQGIELEANIKAAPKLTVGVNGTISRNKIKTFIQFTDVYNYNYEYTGQKELKFANTDIAFSPSVIAAANTIYKITKNLSVLLTGKYVGRQFLDNTSNHSRMLKAYTTYNAQLVYIIKPKLVKEIGISITAYNILNSLYESNGYTWGYYVGQSLTTENFYYPQAGINYMARAFISF